MKISCILVHYHTPELLKRALSAIEKDACASALDVDVIVVDNGSTEKDRPLLESLSAKLIVPGDNLGYAGGINLAVKHSDAEIFIFMNPDVEVLPGCIEALIKALRDGASAAGPRFYMDQRKEIILPPLMRLTRMNEILWRSSVLSRAQAKRVRNHWRKHAKKQWHAHAPVIDYDLTGALLAITRLAWEQVGSFDEVFKLYFEELDWLTRLRRKGLKAYYVPGAEAIHLVNQSAIKEKLAKKWYADSLAIYRRRYYGALFTAFLERVVPVLRGFLNKIQNGSEKQYETQVPSVDLSIFKSVSDKPLWIEVSPEELGIPALGIPIHDSGLKKWVFPGTTWKALEPGKYYLRVADNAGRELMYRRFLNNVSDSNLKNTEP